MGDNTDGRHEADPRPSGYAGTYGNVIYVDDHFPMRHICLHTVIRSKYPMSDKSGLCAFCGRFTESKALDGLADCDRPECIQTRVYEDEFDKAGGIKKL